MAMERLRAAKGLPENQGEKQQFAIDQAMHILRAGGVKDPGQKRTSEELPSGEKPPAEEIERIDPNIEWQRQGQNFLGYKFHVERGFADTDEGKQQYLDTLPKFETQPQEYKGRVDVLMLVEKQIPWERQAELAEIDISGYLRDKIAQTTAWKDNHSQAPDVAYAGWFNRWGQVFPDKISPDAAREKLPADLTGADPFEGVAHEIHFPEDTANGKYFDLIGSQVGSDDVVYLDRWGGGPGLRARWGGDAGSGFRPLVRGSKIVTG